MTMTVPFSERLSEQWLIERTYYVHLRNGRELSVPNLTQAMKRLIDFYVPLSTWQEISQEEAYATLSPRNTSPALWGALRGAPDGSTWGMELE